MAKRAKGLSFDQKRQKMLNIFHSSKDVFNYQQVQKLSIKAGISFPTVKQILQSLIADDLINGDKIGAGNFYWSFPSRAQQILITRSNETQAKIAKHKESKMNMERQFQESQIGREKTQERDQLQQRLKQLKLKRDALKKSMEQYQRFDPERIEMLQNQNVQIKKVGNFWTDNIFQLQKYLKKQFQMKDQDIKLRFQIDPEIDYLE